MGRKDYHEYLSHEFLTRAPGNYCLKCGAKLGNIPFSGKGNWACMWWHPYRGKKVFLGFVHSWDCWEEPPTGEMKGQRPWKK